MGMSDLEAQISGDSWTIAEPVSTAGTGTIGTDGRIDRVGRLSVTCTHCVPDGDAHVTGWATFADEISEDIDVGSIARAVCAAAATRRSSVEAVVPPVEVSG